MAWTKRFEDFFTVGTDEALESHTPDTGASWTKRAGPAASANVEADTDTLMVPYYVGAVARYYSADISGSWADKQKSEAKNANLGIMYRLMVRLSTSDDGYTFYWNTGITDWIMERADNATITQIGSLDGSGPAAGDKWQFTADGSTLKGYKNDVELLSVTDATYSSGTPGLRLTKTETTTGIDDFAGYDEAAATGNPKGVFGLALDGPLRRVVYP